MSKVSFYKTHVKSIILLNTCEMYHFTKHMSKVLFYQTCECQKYYFTKHVNVKSIILQNTCQKYHFTKHM